MLILTVSVSRLRKSSENIIRSLSTWSSLPSTAPDRSSIDPLVNGSHDAAGTNPRDVIVTVGGPGMFERFPLNLSTQWLYTRNLIPRVSYLEQGTYCRGARGRGNEGGNDIYDHLRCTLNEEGQWDPLRADQAFYFVDSLERTWMISLLHCSISSRTAYGWKRC